MSRQSTAVGLFLLALAALPVAQSPSSAGPGSADANNVLTPAEAKAGWKLLFDGRTLNGWTTDGKAEWKVEDGAIAVNVQTGASGNLRTTATYTNYEMTVDFWTEKRNSNSGIYLRCTPAPPGASGSGGPSCYELNISDASDAFPTGSLVNVQSTLPDFRAESWGKWNTLYIMADGDHFVVKLNDRTTVDAHDAKLAGGTVGLQGGGTGLLRFRNLKIRTITK